MPEKHFKIECTVTTNGADPIRIDTDVTDRGNRIELKGADGNWYRFPIDAEIREFTPLRSGHYLVLGSSYLHRVLLHPTQIQYWNGEVWNIAHDFSAPEDHDNFQERAQYLGPLDMNTIER